MSPMDVAILRIRSLILVGLLLPVVAYAQRPSTAPPLPASGSVSDDYVVGVNDVLQILADQYDQNH